MENEPELIRQEMSDTRTALTEKLEALEQKVSGTVTALTETVTTVKENVAETVSAVKDGVGETIHTVQESVGDAVQSVRDALDLTAQTERNPWMMFGGAVAVGVVAGMLLPAPRRSSGPSWVESARDTLFGSSIPHGSTASGPELSRGMASASAHVPHREERREPAPAGGSWLGSLGEMFGPEIDKVKGLALGMAMGAARDLILQSVPPQVGPQVGELVNNLTRKLGGEPVRPHA